MAEVMKSFNGWEIYDKVARDGVVASSEDGISYTATVNGVEMLDSGISFVVVPNMNAVGDTVTLDVNGLGAKSVRRKLSSSPASTVTDSIEEQIRNGIPIRVTYNGSAWVTEDALPNLNAAYGTLPVSSGGTGAEDGVNALHNLGIHWGTESAETYWSGIENGNELKKNTIYIQIVADDGE